MQPISYKRHRFPPETIRLAVWLYFRFTMSLRDVEELLAARGIDVSYETVRCWANKFGPAIAANIRRARGRADSVWHLDEVVVRINGKRMFMWRAVDKEGEVLDVLVQKRRNKAAALKLLKKLPKHQGFIPDVIVTDGLRSYRAAMKILGCQDRHHPGRLQQPGGKFAPSGPTTRAKDATLQVTGPGPALHFNPQCDLQYLRHPTSPDLPKHDAPLPRIRHGGVERCVRRGRMKSRDFGSAPPVRLNLTNPAELRDFLCTS